MGWLSKEPSDSTRPDAGRDALQARYMEWREPSPAVPHSSGSSQLSTKERGIHWEHGAQAYGRWQGRRDGESQSFCSDGRLGECKEPSSHVTLCSNVMCS